MKNIFVILVFSGLLLVINCKSEVQQKDGIIFNVDRALLEDPYEIDSLDFSFAMPLGWKAVSEEVLQVARQKLSDGNSNQQQFKIVLKQFFLDSTSVNFSSLSQVYLNQKITFTELLKKYNQYINNKFKGSDIKKGDFEIDNVKIHQFLIAGSSKIQFKLIFQLSSGLIYQLDYAIDQSKYPNYINKIESSIGSISFVR